MNKTSSFLMYALTLACMLAFCGCDQTFILKRKPGELLVFQDIQYDVALTREVITPVYIDSKVVKANDPNAVIEKKRKDGQDIVIVIEKDKTKEGNATSSSEKIGRDPKIDSNRVNLTNESASFGDSNSKKLVLKVTADYPQGPIEPDSALISGAEKRTGDRISLGKHNFRIEKSGYHSQSGDFEVKTAGGEYLLEVVLQVKDRTINFNITDSKTSSRINPDKVTFSSRRVVDGAKVRPGEYKVEVNKEGYGDGKDGVTVEPSDSPYVLNMKLTPKEKEKVVEKQPVKSNIKFNWRIESEYENEEISNPDSLRVDGVEMSRGDAIKAGSHTVDVEHNGHQPISKKINVAADETEYVFKDVMRTLPRPVEAKIAYDVEPGSNLGATRVTLTPASGGAAIEVESGTRVKPGTYELTVEKEAYRSYRGQKRIFPGSRPYEISLTLEAKPVVIKADISFDIAPPSNLEQHVITFIDKDTNIRRAVYPGGSIKPGRYSYVVEKSGYTMQGNQKDINIEPSEDAFSMAESMTANPRRVTIEANYNNVSYPPSRLIVNDEDVRFEKAFQPGRYTMTVHFDNFRSVTKEIEIVPGTGDFVVKVDVVKK